MGNGDGEGDEEVRRQELSNGDGSERERVGLCTGCRLAVVQTNAKGSAFWRCRRADRDERFLRYPPLPVRRCSGFEPGPPDPEKSPLR